VHGALRARVPFVEHDRGFGPDIDRAAELVRDGTLVEAAESVAGPLART
jgi:histidine ammonia-lyase